MSFVSLLAQAKGNDVEEAIKALSVNSVLISSLALIILIALATKIVDNKKYKLLKKPVFILISIAIILPTLYMTGSTIYLNTISDSGGPVHWHTDIEFWVCDQEIELRDPIGALSNKIGTSTYHEHDDKRIHLEGVVIETEYDASLEKFMDVTGGSINDEMLVIPTEDSVFEDDVDGDKNTGSQEVVRNFLTRDENGRATIAVENGLSCNDGDAGYAEAQVFKFTFNKDNDTYYQEKLENPERYIMRDESIVPPGDCLIVEFDTVKDRTTRLCQQFGVSDSERCVEFGVSEYNPKVCKLREVTPDGGAI